MPERTPAGKPTGDHGEDSPGGLFLVATPIGNLGDISRRAAEVLRSCDLVACEKRSKALRLLNHLGVTKPLTIYHEHNEREAAVKLARMAAKGKSIALISEAGTPGVSDPGFRVVRECRRSGLRVVPVPGPSAALCALSVSGLPTDAFFFKGFLPPRRAARSRFLNEHAAFGHTIILFESRYRIAACLDDIIACMGGDRTIAVAREMTKRHESFHAGTASEVRDRVLQESLKGEFVVLIAKAGYVL